jgi:hypothetical protein
VSAGTYPKVTVDAKGRVTSGSSTITTTDIADGTIANADISGTAAIATSKLSGAVTSISGHGLGALASLSAVGSSEITDGQIADADVSGAAAIATSKLAGALTSIAGHGLGSLATLSTVGSAQITDGQVADADVSGTAAIATSKLSGAVTSITGHGLGSLATLSAVGPAQITDGQVADVDISGTAAIATSKLSGPVTSISGHGLGALATASTVGSTEITDGAVSSTDIADGTIANADISGTAAIATSKLSGAVTSISGHGLGSLATLSAVGSAQITDGQVADADISGTAAIATSKLSGPVTSIAGHGLGSLATLSAVGSAQISDGSITDADIAGAAAISSSKISFVTDSISGNSIDGGTISNFASTGIDDNAGSTVMTINASGSVGIGTTAPGQTLDVAGGIRSIGNSSLPSQVNYGMVWAGGYSSPDAGRFIIGDGSGWRMNFSKRTGDVTTDLITFNDQGSVGIGTTVPSQKLSVAGTVESTSGGFKFPDGTTQTTAAAAGQWTTSGSDVYRSSGNVGVGTTSPAGLLDVNGKLTVLSGGKVGIGTAAPSTMLDINGDIKVGANTGATCASASDGGKMRYNATSGKMQYCNGVELAWLEMSSPVTVAYDYGSSTSSYTSLASGVKIAWGRIQIGADSSATISNLPFTTTLSCMAGEDGNYHGFGGWSTNSAGISGTSCVIYNRVNTTAYVLWMAIGR